jgi:hypothetical protein
MTPRQAIRDAAIKQIQQRGFINVALEGLCDAAGVPPGSFGHLTGKSFTRYMLELMHEGHYGPPRPVTKSRTDPTLLRAHVLTIALSLAEDVTYTELLRGVVASRAGVHPATVYRMFPSCRHMDAAVMDAAVARGNVRVLAQGLAARDPVALRAPVALRTAAAEWVAL